MNGPRSEKERERNWIHQSCVEITCITIVAYTFCKSKCRVFKECEKLYEVRIISSWCANWNASVLTLIVSLAQWQKWWSSPTVKVFPSRAWRHHLYTTSHQLLTLHTHRSGDCTSSSCVTGDSSKLSWPNEPNNFRPVTQSLRMETLYKMTMTEVTTAVDKYLDLLLFTFM